MEPLPLKSVAQTMGLKPGIRAYFQNPDVAALDCIRLPELDLASELEGEFDYLHLFVLTQADFSKHFPKLKQHLRPAGTLWLSWPKGGQLGTDLNIKSVIKLGYDHGLVESTALSVNHIWSGLKFTHPKPGKVYNNSYGKLPSG